MISIDIGDNLLFGIMWASTVLALAWASNRRKG